MSQYERVTSIEEANMVSTSSSRSTPEDYDDDEEKTRVGSYEQDEEGMELEEFSKRRAADREEDISENEGEEQLHSNRPTFTQAEEERVLRKLDRRVVLFVALLYLLSFLDRSNIGNARIAGLERDLKLSGEQYEWLLTAFYITYILFEWMALL
jgi:hypothetical protein